MILTPFHRTSEDLEIARTYETILKENPEADITQYIRNGIAEPGIVKPQEYKKRKWFSRAEKLILGFSLEEKLFQCVVEWEKAETKEDKKTIDLKALGYIRRCCKGESSFTKQCIRFYRDIQNGVFYIT